MKKLSLLFVVLFAVSFAMAQTATTTQTGDNNIADQSQSGGTSNKATVVQNSGSGANLGHSAIQQQIGDANEASISQTGSANTNGTISAEAKQYQRGVSNQAFIQQVKGANSYTNQTQDGDGNYASANTGGTNKTTQYQKGNRNTATLGFGLIQASTVFQNQIGDDNTAGITVTGPGTRHITVRQEQLGYRNKSEIINLRGNDGLVWIDQWGDDNTAQITYNGSQKNKFEVLQNGHWNDLDVTFDADRNHFLGVEQLGDYNHVGLKQSNGSSVLITQNGNLNEVKGLSTDSDPDIGTFEGTTLTIDQAGNSNDVLVNSIGTANVSQTGNFNVTTVSQQ